MVKITVDQQFVKDSNLQPVLKKKKIAKLVEMLPFDRLVQSLLVNGQSYIFTKKATSESLSLEK